MPKSAAAAINADATPSADPLAAELGAVRDTGAANWTQAVHYVGEIAAIIRRDHGHGAEAKFTRAIRAVEMPSDGSICICLDESTSPSIVRIMQRAMTSLENHVYLN